MNWLCILYRFDTLVFVFVGILSLRECFEVSGTSSNGIWSADSRREVVFGGREREGGGGKSSVKGGGGVEAVSSLNGADGYESTGSLFKTISPCEREKYENGK